MIRKCSRRKTAIENHIRRVRKSLEKLELEKDRFSRYRPFIFLGGIALSYWFGWMAIIAAGVLIAIEVAYYNRIAKRLRKHQLWLHIKTTQLARMNLDWEHIPEPHHHKPDETHPFEIDLDLTGPRSLHHLLDVAISHGGSRRLRDWLLNTTPELQKIQTRRKLIRELTPLSRFRDKLLLNFYLVSQKQLDGEKLLHWMRVQPPAPLFRTILPITIILAVVNVGLFSAYVSGWIPGYWVLSLTAYLVLYFLNLPAMTKSFEAVMLLYDELSKLKVVFTYFENYPYGHNEHLKQLCRPFFHKNMRPSRYLRKITWLTTGVGLRMNPMLGFVLNLVIPWDFVCAALINRYQQRCETVFPIWVDTWSELEALGSLANFAYLHPDYAFPAIMSSEESPEAPVFQASAMGHPLLPVEHKVCNDYSFQHPGEIMLLTGSNMSGKSTFLKTTGINLCLAYAGGPVNATTLQTRLLRIWSCIQIHDSIADGLSFFYAEAKRLRKIMEALQADNPLPVLFLIDEIFKGTNSRERLIGSRSYIHRIAQLPGIGVIATHDLELGQLAEQISGLHNAHFRDAVMDGKMVFDYTLHSGVCPTTNALKIMRLEGLPVDMSFEQSANFMLHKNYSEILPNHRSCCAADMCIGI